MWEVNALLFFSLLLVLFVFLVPAPSVETLPWFSANEETFRLLRSFYIPFSSALKSQVKLWHSDLPNIYVTSKFPQKKKNNSERHILPNVHYNTIYNTQ